MIGRFVSRGGEKLEAALDFFRINVEKKVCLDAGASTGGFTDCLLQRGATKVYSVDTAYGELAWKLRNDKRVVVVEKTNILFGVKKLEETGEKVDLAVLDMGWTKLGLVVPKVMEILKPEGEIVALIKPQYEIAPYQEARGGMTRGVLTEDMARVVAWKARENLVKMGLDVSELFPSPVLDEGKNREYFVMIKRPPG